MSISKTPPRRGMNRTGYPRLRATSDFGCARICQARLFSTASIRCRRSLKHDDIKYEKRYHKLVEEYLEIAAVADDIERSAHSSLTTSLIRSRPAGMSSATAYTITSIPAARSKACLGCHSTLHALAGRTKCRRCRSKTKQQCRICDTKICLYSVLSRSRYGSSSFIFGRASFSTCTRGRFSPKGSKVQSRSIRSLPNLKRFLRILSTRQLLPQSWQLLA